MSVGPDNIYRVLKISHYFGLRKLEHSCAEYIVQDDTSLSPDSAINIFIFACRIGNLTIVDRLIERMAENFVHLVKNEKFPYISGNDLLKIFTSPSLMKNPTAQLNFLMVWPKYHTEDEKEEFLPQLINTIDRTHISNDWLIAQVLNTAVRPNVSESDKENELSPTDAAVQSSILNMDLDESDLFTESGKQTKLSFVLYLLNLKIVSERNIIFVNSDWNIKMIFY